jgi:DNA-binding GntR family transcriptional regulator
MSLILQTARVLANHKHKKILSALKKRRANDERGAMRQHILSAQADVESHAAAQLRS